MADAAQQSIRNRQELIAELGLDMSTPSSPYFDMAKKVVSLLDPFGLDDSPIDELGAELFSYHDLGAAVEEAKGALAYRIGSRAAYLDFNTGTPKQLIKLVEMQERQIK